MAHQHALHRPLRVECLCCRLEQRFTFTARSDQVVCASCIKHVGGTANVALLRDRQHLEMWRAERSLVVDDYSLHVVGLEQTLHERDGAITALNERVSDLEGALQAGLAARPVESIAIWLEGTKIAEAEERLDRSRKFIARLFGVLWNVDGAHNRDEPHDDRCSCGLPEGKCPTLAALDPIRNALYKWEAEQVQRIRNGERHNLPDEHPEVLQHEPWRAKATCLERPESPLA